MTKGKTVKATARGGAVALLNAVLGEQMPLAEALLLPVIADLAPQDRARAQRLATSVLRVLEPAEKVLHPLMRKAPPLAILNILRLAVVELADGAAAHGVVNEAVGLARADRRTSHLSGLINAVLRQVPSGVALAGVQKLPRWLRQDLVHHYGRDAVAAMEKAQAASPPLDLTLRQGAEAPEGETLPSGSLRLADKGQVSALAGYEAGGWWVQDAAAAMAVPLLGPIKGQRVLDLCAAPGGKTLQLAAAGAEVTALDISAPRLSRVAENLARTGLAARLVTADALHWQPDHPFDAIVLDAPCSATGTIRRHADLPFVKDGSDIAALATLQAQLLDRALGWLAPGGQLVFVTCSLLPQEGEQQISAALARHPGLKTRRPNLPFIDESWITAEGGLRLRPDYWADKGGMDGFYMAILHR
jgi:16S rRNA (cytosine967-C5)-methyltransferase